MQELKLRMTQAKKKQKVEVKRTFDYKHAYRDGVSKQLERLSRMPAVEGMVKNMGEIDTTKVFYHI